MKKVLFVLFCCTVFVIGCKKAPQDQMISTEQVETTAVVSNDVLISSNVATSTDTAAVEVSTEAAQGEIK